MQLTPIRTLTVEHPMPSGHAFLSAASGLVVAGGHFYVAADDALSLAMFALDGDAPGRLFALLPGSLPRDEAKRKKKKPDFEILLSVKRNGRDFLLALGSGSRKKRMMGVLVALGADGVPATPSVIDLAPLYGAIAPLVAELNLEGAVVEGDRLFLFNRGNAAAPESCIVETSLGALLSGGAVDLRPVARFTLPSVGGVPLTITDALIKPGGILLSAAAEASDDSYNDGALMGAALVRLGGRFEVTHVERIEPALKVEGIALSPNGSLLCVTDADDPDNAAGLYRAALPTMLR